MITAYRTKSGAIIVTKQINKTTIQVGKLDSGLNPRQTSPEAIKVFIEINSLEFLSIEKSISDIRKKYQS